MSLSSLAQGASTPPMCAEPLSPKDGVVRVPHCPWVGLTVQEICVSKRERP